MPKRVVLSPNQVVAYNLTRARKLRGLTQLQACERLERHLGTRWSKATISSAERSIAGERIRQFSADEIVAFALAFELSVGWFFLPPGPDADPRDADLKGFPLVCSGKDGPKDVEDTLTPAELFELTFNGRIGELVREVNARVDQYETHERGVDVAAIRGVPLDHLSLWARALMSDALARDPGRITRLRSMVDRLATQLEALAEIDGPTTTGVR